MLPSTPRPRAGVADGFALLSVKGGALYFRPLVLFTNAAYALAGVYGNSERERYRQVL